MFSEDKLKPFTAEDIRFTKKGETLYAIFLDWPQGESAIQSLGSNALPRYDLFQWGGFLQQSGYPTGAIITDRAMASGSALASEWEWVSAYPSAKASESAMA